MRSAARHEGRAGHLWSAWSCKEGSHQVFVVEPRSGRAPAGRAGPAEPEAGVPSGTGTNQPREHAAPRAPGTVGAS